jgi:hypothetical protein
MRFRRHMAKQTKLGFSFTPRHWPTFTSTDLTDCAGKIAQVGGHAQIFAPWGEQTPVANLAVIKSLCDAQGLAFHLTHDPIGMPQRTQPNIPPQFGTSFTEPAVRSAFIARVMDLASLQPARLGLAAEVNLLWPNSTEYVALVSLTQETYAAVKAAYPLLPLFISFQWDHMLMSVDPLRFQPLADFEASLDFRALTSYPPAWDILTSFPTWYSCFRLLYPTAPVAISEIGYASAAPSTETQQAAFYQSLQSGLAGLDAVFVSIALFHDGNVAGMPSLNTIGVRNNIGTTKKSWNTVKNLVIP